MLGKHALSVDGLPESTVCPLLLALPLLLDLVGVVGLELDLHFECGIPGDEHDVTEVDHSVTSH